MEINLLSALLLVGTLFSFSCVQSEQSSMNKKVTITKSHYGNCSEGSVEEYTLNNANGMIVKVITYGGIITHLTAPDRNGNYGDVVLGFDSLPLYLGSHPFFGAIVGRYGNRIANAQFTLDGQEYQLAANNGVNTLHGGLRGFDKVLWTAEVVEDGEKAGIALSRISPHMEEGYPGNLAVTVTYLLDNEDQLWMEYEATTDQPTICNLTNHSYFNLRGAGQGNIEDHELLFAAAHYTPVDSTLIPTGLIASVDGTPFDFRVSKKIGSDIEADHAQIKIGGGYDHNMVFDHQDGSLNLGATIYEPQSGRVMELHTTEPGVQFYTGNFLDGSIVGKENKSYVKRAAFCLETQHYPDSPNQPDFPSTRLDPGDTYRSTTMHKFYSR